MGRAQDARVSISDVKAARIACISIGVPLHQMEYCSVCTCCLPLWAGVKYAPALPRVGGGKDIACRESTIGRERPTSAKQWRGLTHVEAASVATSMSPTPKSSHVGRSSILGRDRGLDEYGGCSSTSASSPASTLSCVTDIECEGCQLVQN